MLIVCESLSSIQWKIMLAVSFLPWTSERSLEALAAQQGAWHPHATRAWLSLTEDESREAVAPVGCGWVGSSIIYPRAEPASVQSVEFWSFVAWLKATLDGRDRLSSPLIHGALSCRLVYVMFLRRLILHDGDWA